MKVDKNKFLIFISNLIIWTILFLGLNNENGKAIGQITTILLFLNAFFLIKKTINKRNSLLLVLFIFMSLYILPAKYFFFDNLYFSRHNLNYTYYTASFITLLFLLFFFTFCFWVKIKKIENIKTIKYRNNNFIFYSLYIVSLLIIFIFKRSGSHYDGSGGIVQVSPLYEYNLIIFLIIYIYTNNEKLKKRLFNILCVIYIFFTVIVGGRIEIVLLGFLLLTIKYQYIISFKKILFLLFLGIWGMTTFETVRRDPTMIFTNDIITILNPFVEKENIYNTQVSNEGDVYWASERMIVLLEENILTFSDRIESAFLYLISPYVPSSMLPPTANLSNYKIDVYTSGGGGLAFAYFYVMFGFIGVVGLSYFFSKIINSLYLNKSQTSQFYTLLAIMTFARWFVYNPIHIIKFCVWGVLCYYLIISFDYTIKKYKRISKSSRNI